MTKIEEKNKKDFLVIGLLIFGSLIFINLILTLNNPYLSLVNTISCDTNTTKELWEMRGQMGDVLSGHFTALAFIGLLISLQYQRKSIEQMSTTINQQNESFLKQSEALNLQIVEFKQQTEEFEHQTTEFKISNYLQIIERNYSRLNDLEASFTYYDYSNVKHESYRNLLNDLNKASKIAFRDLEMLVSQLKIIETNIQFVHLLEIKRTLENEYNTYKNLYYKDKIESIIYYTFLKQELEPIFYKGYYNNFSDKASSKNLLIEWIKHLEEIKQKKISNLEQQLSNYFLQELDKDKSLKMEEVENKYIYNTLNSFQHNIDLIWNTEPLNISGKVE